MPAGRSSGRSVILAVSLAMTVATGVAAARRGAPARQTRGSLSQSQEMQAALALSAPQPLPASSQPSANDAAAPQQARDDVENAAIYWSHKDADKAQAALQQALQLDPTYARAVYLLAIIQLGTDGADEAKLTFAEAATLDPTLADAQAAMGHLALQDGDFDAAQGYFQRALAIPTAGWRVDYDAALLQLDLQNYSNAKALAQKALTLNPPGPPECDYIAARADDHAGDTRAAMAEYRRYLADHPVSSALAANAQRRLAALTK